MADQEVKVKISADSSSAEGAFARMSNSLKSFNAETSSSIKNIKEHWLGITAAVGAAAISVNKALQYMEQGAQAMREESSFKIMAEEAGVSANAMIDHMRRATKGTVDTSDLMQKATKLMLAEYKPDQIERFSEVAGTAARYMGTTVSEAYDQVSDALANRLPKGLVRAGAVTKEQMEVVKKAMDAGASSTLLMELAIANLAVKQAQLKGTQDEATLSIERFHAQVKDTKEEVGVLIMTGLQKLYSIFQGIGTSSLLASAGISKFLEKKAEFNAFLDPRSSAKSYWQDIAKQHKASAEADLNAARELAQKARENWDGTATGGKTSSTGDIEAAKKKVDVIMAQLSALAKNKQASEDAAKAAKRLAEQWAETSITLEGEIAKEGMNEFARKIQDINTETEKLIDKFKSIPGAVDLINKSAQIKIGVVIEKANEDAVNDMIKEAEEGVNKTTSGLKNYSDFNRMSADENSFSMDPYQNQINQILKAEQEKYAQIEEMRQKDASLTDKAERLKIKVAQNTNQQILDVYSRAAKDKEESDDHYKQAAIANSIDICDNAMAMMDRESWEYNRMQEVKKVLMMAELAMTIQKNLAILTAQPAIIAGKEAEAIAAGAVAIENQGNGDPYTAFARIAAMTAIVSSTLAMAGIAFGGGGGGGGSSASSHPVMGNTTVLGGEYGQASESLTNSIDLLEETYDMEDIKLTKIHNELRSINANIDGLVSSLLRVGNYNAEGLVIGRGTLENQTIRDLTSGQTFDTEQYSSAFLRSLEEGEHSKLFKTIVDAFAYLPELFKPYPADYQEFQEQRYEANYTDLASDSSFLFNKIFSDLGKSLISMAEELGTDMAAVLDYSFGEISFDTRGKTGEEIIEAIQEKISEVGDVAAKALFGSIIGQYQKVNEGLLETATRIIQDKAIVTAGLEMTGQEFDGTIPEMIAFSERLIELAGGLEDLTDAIKSYADAFYTDAEKQVRYKDTLTKQFENMSFYGSTEMEDVFYAYKEVLPATRESYRALVESMDLNIAGNQEAYWTLMKLSEIADEYYSYLEDMAETRSEMEIDLLELQGDVLSQVGKERELELSALDASLRPLQERINLLQDEAAFYDKFYDNAEQMLILQDLLATNIGKVGATGAIEDYSLLASREGFRQLVEGIDRTTESGEAAYQSLLLLSEQADAYYSHLEDIEAQKQSMQIQILNLENKTAEATALQRQDELEAMDASLRPLQLRIWILQDEAKLISDIASKFKAARESMTLYGAGIKEYTSGQIAAQRSLQEMLTSAQAGTFKWDDKYNDVLKTAADVRPEMYATLQEYQRDYYKTYNTLAELEKLAALPESYEDKSISLMQQQLDALLAINNSLGGGLPQAAQEATANQIALNETASAAAAQAAAELAALEAQAAAAVAAAQQAAIAAAQAEQAAQAAAVAAAQKAEAEAAAQKAAEAAAWQEAHPKNQGTLLDKILGWLHFPGYAEGGDFSGGWRVVGEQGPELEYTGPSQIMSNAKSKSLIDNSEVVRELQSLREDMNAIGYAVAKNTAKSAKVADRWDIDGIPAERTLT